MTGHEVGRRTRKKLQSFKPAVSVKFRFAADIVQQPAVRMESVGAEVLQPPVAQLGVRKSKPVIVQAPHAQTVASIVHQSGAQLPSKHHCLLLDKLSSPAERLWYAAKAVEHGWSRNVLALQIEAGLHQRQGKAVTNFKTTLPPAQSDLAQGITKDPYLLIS
jgi:hypothetical protein